MCSDFNCSSCHKQADCVAATYCRCKQEYVGNGKFCCPEGPLPNYSTLINTCCILYCVDMGGEVTLAEATALIRCDRSCSASFKFLRVMWFKNGSPLDLSQTRYGLARKGMLLYVEKLTPADSGEYTCKVHVGQTTYYQRYCSLEVIDSQIRNTPLCCMPADSIPISLLYVECFFSFGLWTKLLAKAICSPRYFDLCWPISMAGYALFFTSWSVLWRSPRLL